MAYEKRRYYVVPIKDLKQDVIDSSITTATNTVRRSANGQKFIVKANAFCSDCGTALPTPTCFLALTPLTHAQALALMRTAEWEAYEAQIEP